LAVPYEKERRAHEQQPDPKSGQTDTKRLAGRPKMLFEIAMLAPTASIRPFDLTPDGRFIVIRPAQEETSSTAPSLVLVQNWFEELKRLVPTN
jgi:hypothetical protein